MINRKDFQNLKKNGIFVIKTFIRLLQINMKIQLQNKIETVQPSVKGKLKKKKDKKQFLAEAKVLI